MKVKSTLTKASFIIMCLRKIIENCDIDVESTAISVKAKGETFVKDVLLGELITEFETEAKVLADADIYHAVGDENP